MAKFKRVKEGDLILADDYNAIARAIERFANLRVAPGSYLGLHDGPSGKALTFDPPRDVLAKLSGASSPYSWSEVQADASGAWSVRGVGRSGTSDAYEINSKSGLADRVVRLTRTSAGDWRFQWVGYGSVACAGTTRICTTVNTGCSGAQGPAYGATVTVTKGGTTYGPCTTDSAGTCCISVPENGTYTVTASIPGVSDISTTVSVTCDIDNNVTLTFPASTIGTLHVTGVRCDATSAGVPAAGTVSVSGPGSASGSFDGSGFADFRLGAGTYTVSVSYSSGYTESRSVTITACGTASAAFSAQGGSTFSIFFGVPGCTYTFTLKDPLGATVATCSITADAFGNGTCTMSYADHKQSNTSDGSTIVVTATVTNASSAWAYNCYTTGSPFTYGAGNVC
jgi:hypothetical protein